jgi:type I restriction enzyme S subunit
MDYLDPAFVNLPLDWRARSIAEVAEIHNRRRAPIKGLDRESMKGPFPYCGANGVVDYIDRFAYDGEYVLIAEDGGHWGRYEPSAYIMTDRFWVNNHAHVLRGRENVLDNQFLLYLLTYTNIDPIIGGDARGKLTQSLLTQLILPYPPLAEQRQIARVLSAVQRAVDRQKRLIALSAELKKALMHKLFTEGTRGEPLKQTEIGAVPKSWDVLEFELFVVLQRGKDLPKAAFKPGTIPVIGATTTIGFHDTANVHGPGVTVVRSGSSAGKASYIETDFWAHNVVLYIKNFRGNDPRFSYYKLCSLDLTRFKSGVAVPTLNRNAFRTINVAIPKLVEQKETAAILDAVERRTQIAVRTLNVLSDGFRTLLHQLMTAQVRVHELDLTALEDSKVEAAEAL